jgi:dimethylhistidine N-methyltransferase
VPTTRSAIELLDLHPDTDSLREEVLAGLSKDPKSLSPKFLYDAEGSRLFDRITQLEAYYPTRTEVSILRKNVDEIAAAVGEGARLVELGSGSSLKTHILLDRIAPSLAAYVPVDISRGHLMASAERLAGEYDGLLVQPVCADYTRPFPLPGLELEPERTVVFFPGSTIGNFQPSKALSFLRAIARGIGQGGGLVIGVDLLKDAATLEAAYDDPEGVTAAFDLNLLRRLNRDLGADFDLSAFAHRAVYRSGVEAGSEGIVGEGIVAEESVGRVEMHLVSQREQTVRVAGEAFIFGEGETIHTESSYKYAPAGFEALASEAGFRVEAVWTDADALFSVQHLVVR